MIYSLLIVALIALLSPFSVSASSTGAPICRATQLNDVTGMTGAVAGANNFTLTATATSYTPGQKLTFTIDHPTASTQFLGFLAVVEKTATTPVGTFDAKTGATLTGNFPSECNGKSTSITHNSAAPKSVPYTLSWNAPVAGTGAVTARVAVMINPRSFQFLNIDLTEGPAATTPAPRSSALQSGPIAIIIGTMMALGLAIIKQF